MNVGYKLCSVAGRLFEQGGRFLSEHTAAFKIREGQGKGARMANHQLTKTEFMSSSLLDCGAQRTGNSHGAEQLVEGFTLRVQQDGRFSSDTLHSITGETHDVQVLSVNGGGLSQGGAVQLARLDLTAEVGGGLHQIEQTAQNGLTGVQAHNVPGQIFCSGDSGGLLHTGMIAEREEF